jgi:hypothetical protein
VREGDQSDPERHEREARHGGDLAAETVHQHPGRDEHRDVEDGARGDDGSDLRHIEPQSLSSP